jgi:hypothetical protein
MVGDRFLTDVAFGNRLGMLTIRPQPFTKVGEPTMVKFVSVQYRIMLPGCFNFLTVFNRLSFFLADSDTHLLQSRWVEGFLVAICQAAGVTPPHHPLLRGGTLAGH